MKELKFRAFHKPSKKMFDVGMIDFLYETVYEYISHGFSSSDAVELYDFHECELMQFTGLKDVDGKEIFEGDIVEITFNEEYSDDFVVIEDDAKNIYEVVFYDDCFFFVSTYYLPLYSLDEIDFNIKILGNIYQNSELLERK